MGVLPLGLVVGVVLGDGRDGVAEHHVGVVEGLLDLHGSVGAAAHVIPCIPQRRPDRDKRLETGKSHRPRTRLD